MNTYAHTFSALYTQSVQAQVLLSYLVSSRILETDKKDPSTYVCAKDLYHHFLSPFKQCLTYNYVHMGKMQKNISQDIKSVLTGPILPFFPNRQQNPNQKSKRPAWAFFFSFVHLVIPIHSYRLVSVSGSLGCNKFLTTITQKKLNKCRGNCGVRGVTSSRQAQRASLLRNVGTPSDIRHVCVSANFPNKRLLSLGSHGLIPFFSVPFLMWDRYYYD